MFIKNDSSLEKRYFNGKIGVVTAISNKNVTVKCPNETKEIITESETWENINYTINDETKEIKEKINLLLSSDAINYLETSERLALTLTLFRYNLALLSSIPPLFNASAAIKRTSANRIDL